MPIYNATVDYTTRKGNLKNVSFGVTAPDINAARKEATETVQKNGLRQVKSIDSVTVRLVAAPSKPGFFQRLANVFRAEA